MLERATTLYEQMGMPRAAESVPHALGGCTAHELTRSRARSLHER